MMKLLSFSRRPVRPVLLLLLAVGAGTACGENLFNTDNPPKLNAFAATSESVLEGDTITFTVDASGPRTIEEVRVMLSGAMTGDTTFQVDDPSTSVTGEIWLAVPLGTGPSAELTVTAWAIDVAPDTSASKVVTVQIADATDPTVSVTAEPDEVGAGEPIHISLSAADNRGVELVGVTVTDNAGYDTTLTRTIDPARLAPTATLELIAPAIDLGDLVFTPFATDINDLEGEGDPVTVTVADRKGPTFLSLETAPDSTIPLGDSLQVIVEVSDPAGIQQVTFIGLAYRGTPSMGTDSVVERFTQKTIEFPRPTEGGALPTSYRLNPYLQAPDKTTTEPVEIFVVAQDALGNVSDTTKLMYVGGPDVGITYPPDDFAVGVGDDFNVHISIDDGTGIDSAKLFLTGAKTQTIDLVLPPRTDTPFVLLQQVVMPNGEGTVNIQARAWNPAEVSGQSRSIPVVVLQEPPSDTTPPIVSLEAERLVPTEAEDRMEKLDRIRVTVSAFDGNAGVERIGLKLIASWAGGQQEITRQATFGGSKNLESLVYETPVDSLLYDLFNVTTEAELDSILPTSLDLRFHGFAADTVDEVACAVGVNEQRKCSPDGYSSTAYYQAADTSGLLLEIEAVRGVTVLLDERTATIADLAIDTVDDRLFLSNITQNLVEVLQLDDDIRQASFFADPVQVGSEPWGVFMGERVVSQSEETFGNIGVTAGQRLRTLLVANSGGTNISLVHLDPLADRVQEVDVVRLRTPNSVLYEVEETTDEFGNVRYTIWYYDLADRPQFLAQDSLLRIVYSTIETEVAPTSTVRFVHVNPDPTLATDLPEVRFLLTGDMVNAESETVMALGNVDSVLVKPIASGSDSIRVFTHEPGYPENVIYNTTWRAQLADAVADVEAQLQVIMTGRGVGGQAPMFFPFLSRGTWDFDALGWADTTFVAASGDRGTIAIGEGARTPTGRIMLWHAKDKAEISDEVQIADLVNNASEQVLGVGLNQNGSLGVARGREATYFFTPDLRLQGLYRQEELGGAGAAFHPGHDEVSDGGHLDTDGAGVAFTGTSEHSIDVVNTFHFNQVNKLMIRDNVVGPLKAGPPLPTDNNGQGGSCVALNAGTPAELDCIVAKVYGITSAGGVLVLNVRKRDLDTDS